MAVKTVGSIVTVQQFLNRPNDTDVYESGDVVDTTPGGGLTFDAAARAPGLSGVITDALFIDGANQATKGAFEVWIYSEQPGLFDDDNIAYTAADSDMLDLVGVLPFNTDFIGDDVAGGGGVVIYHADRTFLPLGFKTSVANDLDDLFGVIVVRNAYVPIALGQFTVTLKIDQN